MTTIEQVKDDPSLAGEFIAENENLIRFALNKTHVVWDTLHRTEDDLMQEGRIAMLKAIEGFDPNRGVKFATYAITWIQGGIKVYVRDRCRPVWHMSRDDVAIHNNATRLRMLGYTEDEIPKELGLLPLTFLEISDAVNTASFEAPISQGDDFNTTLSSTTACSVNIEKEVVFKDLIRYLLSEIPIPERKILLLRLEGQTQSEIGKLAGCTQKHISRTISKWKNHFIQGVYA